MPDRNNRPKYYWDACVFLSFINGDEDRIEVIRQLLEEAPGKHEIVTSTVSIVEVAFGKAEQDSKAPDSETLAEIEALWLPDSGVELAEFHRLVANDARDLVRLSATEPDETKIKPLDAVHLATAQRLSVDEFHTYDKKLLALNGTLSFPVVEPWTASPRLPGLT
jgi:predicted nucleic acid-binding protein